MAFSIKGLVDNIQATISSFGATFFGRTAKGPGNHPSSPAIDQVIAQIQATNWTKSFPYTFAVVTSDSDLSPFENFTDFPLPINPSEINQDENFAISIRPTQGGTMINHSGNRYKDLAISGTTGVHPNRGAGGASKITGRAIAQPNELKYFSGYEVFLKLRNYFRAYYEMKRERKDDAARSARLVFKNFKDGEMLIIEVPKFSMKRSATRPFMYDYTINAMVIGNVSFRSEEQSNNVFDRISKGDFDGAIELAVGYIDEARGIFLRSQDIVRQIEATYQTVILEPLRKTGLAVKAFMGVGTLLADLGPKLTKETVSTKDTLQIMLGIKNIQDTNRNQGTLDPRLENVVIPTNLDRVVSENGSNLLLNLPDDSSMALSSTMLPLGSQNALLQDQQDSLDLPRSFYEDLRDTLVRIQDNAYDYLNLNDADYDSLYERTPTLSAETTKRATDAEFEVLAGFEKAIAGLNLILATNAMFKSSYPDLIRSTKNSFSDPLALKSEPAVKQIRLPKDITLERLALEQLGDSNRWVEIVQLNNLKPPYIVSDMTSTAEAVKKPGDNILIPQPIRNGFATTPINRQSFLTQDLSEVEKNLGIDLKLSPDFDLELNNRNDLNLIRGIDNAAQALIIKLSLGKKELLDHPDIGVGLQVGEKAPPLVQVQTDIIQTLSQDPRFERLEDLQITRESSTFFVKFLIKIKNVDTPVPVEFKI